MKFVMVVLIFAMIAKDTSQLNDPYIMRGVAQGLCLVFGVGWLITNISSGVFKRYWPLFGYLFISFISCIFSTHFTFAMMQFVSILAVIVFFIAYFESQNKQLKAASELVVNSNVILYTITCFLSLILIKIYPSIVYGVVGEYTYTTEVRYKGLFPGAGSLAAPAGLLAGFVFLKKNGWWLRAPVIVIALSCLFLTQSRTFWVALIVSLAFTWWLYYPKKRKQFFLSFLVIVPIVVTAFFVFNIQVETKAIEKVARIQSVTNLSGRLPLWEIGFKGILKKPLFGYGLTMGSLALYGSNKTHSAIGSGKQGDRSVGRTTLHNGYMQSLLDIGILGTFFYFSVVFLSLRKLIKFDSEREHAAVFFGIVFLAVANLGENVIYGASVYTAILFWCLTVFALQITKAKKNSKNLFSV